MGDLPNDVRTHLVRLEAMDIGLLVSLLMNKKVKETHYSHSLSSDQ